MALQCLREGARVQQPASAEEQQGAGAGRGQARQRAPAVVPAPATVAAGMVLHASLLAAASPSACCQGSHQASSGARVDAARRLLQLAATEHCRQLPPFLDPSGQRHSCVGGCFGGRSSPLLQHPQPGMLDCGMIMASSRFGTPSTLRGRFVRPCRPFTAPAIFWLHGSTCDTLPSPWAPPRLSRCSSGMPPRLSRCSRPGGVIGLRSELVRLSGRGPSRSPLTLC
jgi:hypothetical protein